MSNTLKAWTFLEMINPGIVPSRSNNISQNLIKNKKRFKQVVPISQSHELMHELDLKKPESYKKVFTYFVDIYLKQDLIDLLRKFFASDDEIINRETDRCYGFSFSVDESGTYIEQSLFVPHVQLLINEMLTKEEIVYSEFLNLYEEKEESFKEEIEVLFQNKVGFAEIEKAKKVFNKYFRSISRNSMEAYVQCQIISKQSSEIVPKFNSFYLNDLQLILEKGMNETIREFAEGKNFEVDIDENRQAIEQYLDVDQLPLGRWPSPVNHRLSLMQQVAVNHVLNHRERISSVNGPPGTGKTTLLKDIFAQLIVERAMEMAKLKDPKKAFKKFSEKHFNGYPYKIYELSENIARYSMVVASSNNGAVENISKELPLLEEVVRRNDPPSVDERKEMRGKTGIDPIIFHKYDAAYAEEVESLDYFTELAEILLEGEKAWGVFSGAFGKRKNINNISKSLYQKGENHQSFYNQIKEPVKEGAWQEAVQEFKQLQEEVERERELLKHYVKQAKEVENIKKDLKSANRSQEEYSQKLEVIETKLNIIAEREQLIKEQLDNLPPPTLLQRINQFFTSKKSDEEFELKNRLNNVINKKEVLLEKKDQFMSMIRSSKDQVMRLQQKLKGFTRVAERFKGEEVILSSKEFWEEDFYERRQLAVLGQSHQLNFKRGLLFLKALKVHKVFIYKNHEHIAGSIAMLLNLRSINFNVREERESVARMWKVIHLIFPVISTTFASFSSMYRGMGKDFIDYLFIDEAGQASPQEAAGALWRSKRAIVVGDPKQVEPVVTLDPTILSDVRKAFGLSRDFIGTSASVQGVADLANPVGTYIKEESDYKRIGIPLWVHRRCIEPMFSIANEIAYENKMVLANKQVGNFAWYDVKGSISNAQYVPQQGHFVIEKLKQHFREMGENEFPSVFIITPFKEIECQLINLADKMLKHVRHNLSIWLKDSIGTVHTFQGKEADIVYFVTGTDESTEGAANWSCSKPNLINVAATRAKKEFYVVGDRERFKNKSYYRNIMKQFQNFNE